MTTNCNWTINDDEILVKFVRKHEAIYNIRSKYYRKTQLKKDLWCEIGGVLNKTDADCSKRWCYIRDYYIRRRGKPGICSIGEAAKKRSDLLSFLDSYPSPQRNGLNVTDENSADGSVIMENTHENTEETHSNSQEMDYLMSDNYDSSSKSEKKRKINSHSQERLKLLRQIADQYTTQNELDETDLFFSSMAKIVKKLPRYEQAQLRMQIGSIVGDAELSHIMNNSTQSSAISSRVPNNDGDY